MAKFRVGGRRFDLGRVRGARAARPKFNLTGDKELRKNFRKIFNASQESLREAVRPAAKQMVQEVKRQVARSGIPSSRLKQKIDFDVLIDKWGQFELKVGPEVEVYWAMFWEFGFQVLDPITEDVRAVIRPHPFMRPAADLIGDDVKKGIKKRLIKVIQDEGKKHGLTIRSRFL